MNENPATAPTTDDERIRATLSTGLDRLMNVSADRVFAEPVRIGDRVVIPAAAIEVSGGFGFGGDSASNGGGGGGGHQAGRPVAIIEAGPQGVRVKPVIDFTKVGLTVVAAALTVMLSILWPGDITIRSGEVRHD